MVIEYTDFDEFIDNVDHNCIGYCKYSPRSERWYVIKKKASYFKIESFDEIERKILKLDLPKNYNDLEAKTSSIIKLWLLLVRYAELLIENNYIEYCDLYDDELRFFKRYKYIHFDLTDLNYIQRKLLDLHNNLSKNIPAGKVFYDGYTEELSNFAKLVKADIKLFKYNRQYIDSHRVR